MNPIIAKNIRDTIGVNSILNLSRYISFAVMPSNGVINTSEILYTQYTKVSVWSAPIMDIMIRKIMTVSPKDTKMYSSLNSIDIVLFNLGYQRNILILS